LAATATTTLTTSTTTELLQLLHHFRSDVPPPGAPGSGLTTRSLAICTPLAGSRRYCAASLSSACGTLSTCACLPGSSSLRLSFYRSATSARCSSCRPCGPTCRAGRQFTAQFLVNCLICEETILRDSEIGCRSWHLREAHDRVIRDGKRIGALLESDRDVRAHPWLESTIKVLELHDDWIVHNALGDCRLGLDLLDEALKGPIREGIHLD
jgi:hypothetical protein